MPTPTVSPDSGDIPLSSVCCGVSVVKVALPVTCLPSSPVAWALTV
jgi:hypothetical protein